MPLIQTPPDELQPAPTLGARLKAAVAALVTPTPPTTPAAEPLTVTAAQSTPLDPPKPVGISDQALARLCGGTVSPDNDRLMRSMFRPGNGF
jgi:hypothetical protein